MDSVRDGAHAGGVGAEEQRRAILAQVTTQLRDLADYLRGERARMAAAGTSTDEIDQVLAELEPIVVGVHDAEVASAVTGALDIHGPGPWMDADLASVAGVDLTDLRRLRDQLLAAGMIHRPDEPSPPR